MLQFIAHSALDIIDEVQWTNGAMYLKCVDRFYNAHVSAFVTGGGARFFVAALWRMRLGRLIPWDWLEELEGEEEEGLLGSGGGGSGGGSGARGRRRRRGEKVKGARARLVVIALRAILRVRRQRRL